MCNKRSTVITVVKKKRVRVDPCMRDFINNINKKSGYTTLASCCGHSIYPMTLVVKNDRGLIFEFFTAETIPRKKRFYKKDGEGFYYIPEVLK